MARRTIAKPASVSGVGLHTGAETTVTCRPGEPGQGLLFRRSDLPDAPAIPGRLESVSSTERCTSLGPEDRVIHTVEHLLAVVGALAIDDMTIEVSGPELPIGDGSFAPFMRALCEAGAAEHEGEPVVYRVTAPFQVVSEDASYVVSPADGLRLTATIEWNHPLIGRQAGSWQIDADSFATEISNARTFGFVHEVEALRARGLVRGGSPDTAVVLSDDGIVGGALRWPDEFVRHKAGDVVGDLALLGGRVEAHVVAVKPSHRGNLALARQLVRAARQEGGSTMDIGRILEVIPHRYPFLLVDRIIEVEDRRRIVGIKNVTINEPFFQGHFPGHPIMPGVLIIEAMAQIGGMLLLDQIELPEEKVVYFMSLDNVKFRRPVVPGDQLRCELEMIQFRGRTCRMKGTAYVDGQVVTEADMMARIVDR